ncbi:MAG TPA: DUF3072 domain-containing protein [Pseudonocardiaceae bacterium]|nr:DUF3072 domain-containing protein [Pseudonocardiaceae bacterium]
MSAYDPRKDVEDWATGEEPATGPQLSYYLETLARQAGEEVPQGISMERPAPGRGRRRRVTTRRRLQARDRVCGLRREHRHPCSLPRRARLPF